MLKALGKTRAHRRQDFLFPVSFSSGETKRTVINLGVRAQEKTGDTCMAQETYQRNKNQELYPDWP